MPEFKDVKHLYLEISVKLFQDPLKQHFTKGSSLDQAFSCFGNQEQDSHFKSLITAAQKWG